MKWLSSWSILPVVSSIKLKLLTYPSSPWIEVSILSKHFHWDFFQKYFTKLRISSYKLWSRDVVLILGTIHPLLKKTPLPQKISLSFKAIKSTYVKEVVLSKDSQSLADTVAMKLSSIFDSITMKIWWPINLEPDQPDPEIKPMLQVLSEVIPREVDQRSLPGSDDPEFSSRLETGIDCDFVFQDSILIGNL